jgi:NAD(P)-dependent dehydrogenase (short-subunit alcohol dehydrogenase family)
MVMKPRLKRLADQVIVITGASSGIGLATARRAAGRGAAIVAAARSAGALNRLVGEIRGGGGRAIAVVADVGVEDDVRRIGAEAVAQFGRFDTWINNAAGSVYGECLDVSIADMQRVIDTNFWGVVYGSRVACAHLQQHGGALINVGSEVSDRAVPLQGIYSASKHAVKGWTDALRTELEYRGVPISVSLVKPGPINTPYAEHAKNYLDDAPVHTPPVYAVDSVVAAILHCATTPVRDIFVGGAARLVSAMSAWAPRLTDSFVANTVIPRTHSGKPRYTRPDALHHASEDLRERGDYDGLVRPSVYTHARMHPLLTASVLTLAGGLLLRGRLARG